MRALLILALIPSLTFATPRSQEDDFPVFKGIKFFKVSISYKPTELNDPSSEELTRWVNNALEKNDLPVAQPKEYPEGCTLLFVHLQSSFKEDLHLYNLTMEIGEYVTIERNHQRTFTYTYSDHVFGYASDRKYPAGIQEACGMLAKSLAERYNANKGLR